ncbi:MAG TPA: DeoR/GlpR transcriptional regulator [Firmicutes bacterium]|nr:DeoR/GlpR transcriptional regulator [Bacillota bacterium]
MNSARRLEEIAQILAARGSVEVQELAKQFRVTGKTIRLDLDKLARMGMVERVHGGAVLKQPQTDLFQIRTRRKTNIREKQAIAQKALEHIKEDDIILIDGGSTTQPLSRLLGEKRLTLLTNDLLIAGEVLEKENVTLYVTGGKLSDHRREGVYTLLGRDAEALLQKYKVNKLFLAATALNFKQGLMVYSEDVAAAKKAMLQAAEEVILLVDYTKFHQQAFLTFARLEEIDTIITDDRIPDHDVKYLESRGIKVEVARLNGP